MGRIDLEIRDLVYKALLVPASRDGVAVDERLAWERANNLAMAICANFKVEFLDERPDLDDAEKARLAELIR